MHKLQQILFYTGTSKKQSCANQILNIDNLYKRDHIWKKFPRLDSIFFFFGSSYKGNTRYEKTAKCIAKHTKYVGLYKYVTHGSLDLMINLQSLNFSLHWKCLNFMLERRETDISCKCIFSVSQSLL